MDDDIDEELLSVTAGSSKSKKTRKRESSDEEGQVSDSDSDERSRPAKKKTAKKPKSAKKKKDESSEDEDAYKDEYDEDLMGDEDDRKYLYSLPEIEREAIIADRYAKRKEAQERHKLTLTLKNKGSRLKETDSPRSSSRTGGKKFKSIGNKASALSDLKKRRAKAQSGGAGSSSSSEEDDDKDDSGDSEDDYVAKESKTNKPKEREREREREESPVRDKSPPPSREDSQPLTKEDMNKVTLSRTFMEKYFEEPFFDELVLGFFVRVGIGVSHEKPVYRAAQIQEVKEGPKKYKFAVTKQSNKLLVLRHGTSAKSFSMDVISNQIITESEYQKWIAEEDKEGRAVMSSGEANKKWKTLQIAENYKYTDEVIAKMIQRKKQMKATPVNVSVERARVLALRDVAKDAGDTEEFEKLATELADLDARIQGSAVDDKMTAINKKNVEKNFVTQITIPQEVATGAVVFDPFQRRQTLPERITFAKSAEQKPAGAPVAANGIKTEEKDDVELLQKKENPEDILKDAHNLEIESPVVPRVASVPRRIIPSNSNAPKKPTLSLEEYKRRRGLL
eukprot:TRINITY_DN515_c0_g1_i1.p1 TRINITY_DN515_c0_g1~~TRINITY_DN515_c0_g1_i1.p1  ORF type:complete len:565 (-),score=218.65 TRINITY_DN515_c0_g1_i1:38-1732(-)